MLLYLRLLFDILLVLHSRLPRYSLYIDIYYITRFVYNITHFSILCYSLYLDLYYITRIVCILLFFQYYTTRFTLTFSILLVSFIYYSFSILYYSFYLIIYYITCIVYNITHFSLLLLVFTLLLQYISFPSSVLCVIFTLFRYICALLLIQFYKCDSSKR